MVFPASKDDVFGVIPAHGCHAAGEGCLERAAVCALHLQGADDSCAGIGAPVYAFPLAGTPEASPVLTDAAVVDTGFEARCGAAGNTCLSCQVPGVMKLPAHALASALPAGVSCAGAAKRVSTRIDPGCRSWVELMYWVPARNGRVLTRLW